jgi:putative ABC transport system permease protein
MNAVGLGGVDLQPVAIVEQGANKVVRLQSLGLWLAAGIAFVTGLVVIGQVLARQRNRAAGDVAIAGALGLTRRQAVTGAAITDTAVALAGAVLGAGVAVALSPLTPFGLARKVEPDPGVWIDGTVLAAGLVATAVAVVAIGALSMIMLLHRQSPRTEPSPLSASRVGALLAEPLGTGWRVAFGRRRAVAQALAPATMTVIAFVVVATGVHDVSALPQRPELTGGTWDAAVFVEDPASQATVDRVLRDGPDVATVARGGWTDVLVAGTDVYTQVLEPDAGVKPAIVRGRAPVGENEIALGGAVLEQLGIDVDDTVSVSFDDQSQGETATWRVVGEVVVASPLFRSITPDGGALISDAAYLRWLDDGPMAFLVSFREGIPPQQGLDAALAPIPDIQGMFAFARTARGDVVALDSMVALPWILVGFLALLTVASLAQWSILSSRRERHRAAVLRALGLTGSQVSTAFVVAALLVAGTSCLVGVTIGVAVAGAVWDAVARWLIVVPSLDVPWKLCSAIIAITTIVAMAIALWTSRRHAGSPAPQLRVE